MTGTFLAHYAGKRVRLIVGDFEPVAGKVVRAAGDTIEFVPETNVFGPETANQPMYVDTAQISILIPLK